MASTKCLAAGALALTVCAAFAQMTNGSFETPQFQPNSWNEIPANVPGWSFAGRCGIGNGDSPWALNAHTGTQYVYFASEGQNSGRLRRKLAGFVPGQTYRIRFWMCKRPNQFPVTLSATLNGVSIMRPCHSMDIWLEYATDWFKAPADNTVLEFFAEFESAHGCSIDDVSVEPGPEPPLRMPGNASFERPPFQQGTWQSPAHGIDIAWYFSPGTGIEHGPSSWGSHAQDGNQYAFLSDANYFYQRIGFFQPDTTYHAEWYMMRRDGNVGGNWSQPIHVLFDGSEICRFIFYGDPIWRNFATVPFDPANTEGILRFEGMPGTTGATLYDDVRVIPNSDLALSNLYLDSGTYVSGGPRSLGRQDDRRLLVAPAKGLNGVGAPVRIVAEAFAPTSDIKYLAVSLGSPGSHSRASEQIELWNAAQRRWMPVQTDKLAGNDEMTYAVRLEDAAQFVDKQTGKIVCRVTVSEKPSGFQPAIVQLDLLRISVTR